jgi:hypothetical protein
MHLFCICLYGFGFASHAPSQGAAIADAIRRAKRGYCWRNTPLMTFSSSFCEFSKFLVENVTASF